MLSICFCSIALATPARSTGAATVPALMVSDIHFDPFWDLAKTQKLAVAPVGEWKKILSGPDSSDRQQRFAALQASCPTRGTDTEYALLASSVRAMHAEAADARFITLSGDLIAHGFDCKYRAAFPHSSESEYESFVTRTIAFVESEMHAAVPGAVIYTALGNNDSGCGDYKLDEHGGFLARVGPAIAAHLGVSQDERAQVLRQFAVGADYSVPFPALIRHARVIVLNDLFLAKNYQSCSGKPAASAAADEIAWLRNQLEAARRTHEKVWVIAHIPPGINPYSTARNLRDVCGGEPADLFLSSDALGKTLAEFGDVIRLAVFAHTHMDELRLLQPVGGATVAHPAVAVKMIGSISPIDGNKPSFTVAQVKAATAELVDYQVYAASNASGVNTTWSKEYDFRDSYHEPVFTAKALADLIAQFQADGSAKLAVSQNYLRDFFVGDRSAILVNFWKPYVCALANQTPESYRSCVCSTGNKR